MAEKIDLSVVIPAYNEAARIVGPLEAIADYLVGRGGVSEVVVVDDGSADDTTARVRAVAAELPVEVRTVRYAPNRGKGFALKVGFAHARGDRILFSDADLSTPIEEADALLAALDAGCDVAIGSRKMPGARIEVRQPRYREQMGKVFTWLVRWSIADVSDVTCGFKAFRGRAGRDLFAHMRIADWSFDAELLYLAKRHDLRLAEVPVRWHDEVGSKVDLRRDVLRTLLGLFRIRANSLRGVYREPFPLDVAAEVWETSERRPLAPLRSEVAR